MQQVSGWGIRIAGSFSYFFVPLMQKKTKDVTDIYLLYI